MLFSPRWAACDGLLLLGSPDAHRRMSSDATDPAVRTMEFRRVLQEVAYSVKKTCFGLFFLLLFYVSMGSGLISVSQYLYNDHKYLYLETVFQELRTSASASFYSSIIPTNLFH